MIKNLDKIKLAFILLVCVNAIVIVLFTILLLNANREANQLADTYESTIGRISTEYKGAYTDLLSDYDNLLANPVEVPVYIDREVVREVIKEVELPTIAGWSYKPFKSESEIRGYVFNTGIPGRLYTTKDYDCDDYSLDLWEQSIKDGRLMGLLMVVRLAENGNIDNLHMLNFTLKGNYIYQVEPQTGNAWQLLGYDAKLD